MEKTARLYYFYALFYCQSILGTNFDHHLSVSVFLLFLSLLSLLFSPSLLMLLLLLEPVYSAHHCWFSSFFLHLFQDLGHSCCSCLGKIGPSCGRKVGYNPMSFAFDCSIHVVVVIMLFFTGLDNSNFSAKGPVGMSCTNNLAPTIIITIIITHGDDINNNN